MLTIEVFAAGIEDLKKNFPDALFTERKYKAWFKELQNRLTPEEFEEAIDLALFRFTKCPTGEDLLNLVKSSGKELVTKAWADVLEALSKKLSLNDLDKPSQYAIARLGGTSHLEALPITKLHDLRYEFANHYNSYLKNPVEFTPPVQTITPEQREFKSETASDDFGKLTPEQKARNQMTKQNIKMLAKGMSMSEKIKAFMPPEPDDDTESKVLQAYRERLMIEEQDMEF